MPKYVDTGIDYNEDNHCDIEGYFLNSRQSHRPIVRETNEKTTDLEGKIKKKFSLEFDIEHFYFPTDQNIIRYTPSVIKYTLNDNNRVDSSPNINRVLVLRHGNPVSFDLRNTIDLLDGATSMFSAKKDMYVFRGIGGDFAKDSYVLQAARKRVGDTYSDKAFLSTSTSLFAACKFADVDKSNIAVILKMKLPRGTKCVPITCNDKNECEILLGREKQFRIIGKNYSNVEGKIVVSLTMVLEK